MLDICTNLNLKITGIENLEKIHSHVLVTPFKDIAIKVYLNNDKGQRDNLIEWIKKQLSYKDFGRSIEVNSIKTPAEIESIDFINSRIQGIFYTEHARDQHGEFLV